MKENDLPFDRGKHAVYTKNAKKCVLNLLRRCYDEAAKYYKNRRSTGSAGKRSVSSGRTRRRTGSKKSSS